MKDIILLLDEAPPGLLDAPKNISNIYIYIILAVIILIAAIILIIYVNKNKK